MIFYRKNNLQKSTCSTLRFVLVTPLGDIIVNRTIHGEKVINAIVDGRIIVGLGFKGFFFIF